MEIHVTYSCEDPVENRKYMFKSALKSARYGRVLYILPEEIMELPEEINSTNRYYMKMIRFMYTKSLKTLLETIAILLDWQTIPSTILVEGVDEYCSKEKLQQACGLISFLIDTVQSCARKLEKPCSVFVSINKNCTGDDYCNILRGLYRLPLNDK